MEKKKPAEKSDREQISVRFIDDAECPSKDCLECPSFKWSKKFKYSCKNEISWYSAMPLYLIDRYMKKVSSSAWKVFTFLNRRANWGSGEEDKFGMCWFTFKQVEKATGIKASNMAKYLKELQRAGLITFEVKISKRKTEFKTIHVATIVWFRLHKELDLRFPRAQSIKSLFFGENRP